MGLIDDLGGDDAAWRAVGQKQLDGFALAHDFLTIMKRVLPKEESRN